MPDHDPDLGCTPYERTRRALHRSVDTITQAWPHALEDANARGYPTGIDYNARGNGSSILAENECGQLERVPVTSVEAVALQPSRAVGWLCELHDIVYTLYSQLGWQELQPELVISPAMFKPVILHRCIEQLCTDWPPKAEHTARTVIRLANTAHAWWPPPEKAHKTTVKGLLDAETCLYCQIDAYPGDRRAIKTAGGEIEGYVHKTPCWYAVTMARGQHPRQRAS